MLSLDTTASLLVVGAPMLTIGSLDQVGSVFVFSYSSASSWTFVATLPQPPGAALEWYTGGIVALSGSWVIVSTGGISPNTYNGGATFPPPTAVHLYQQAGSQWQYVKPFETDGLSLYNAALNGNYAAISTYAGVVKIFSQNQGGTNSWGKILDIPYQEVSGASGSFGACLSISASSNTIVVGDDGAINEAGAYGSAYVFAGFQPNCTVGTYQSGADSFCKWQLQSFHCTNQFCSVSAVPSWNVQQRNRCKRV
eukprot:TRINITY_DN8300_c0_g5_i1.p2 TRINITY_DN8300_c0_g5~~TRINITY_DN8300_c0_g5_i1.p2  ORF type:complete len:253 (+),score=46.27 TRINITY_DN8300_c0_g5_i1:773-1531(+)